MASEKSWRGKKKGLGPGGAVWVHPPKTLAFRGFLHYLLLPRCLTGGEGLSFLQQDIGVGGVLSSAWDDELGLEGDQVLASTGKSNQIKSSLLVWEPTVKPFRNRQRERL